MGYFGNNSLELFGKNDLSVEDPGEATIDRNGLQTISVVWRIAKANYRQLPGPYTPHPIFTALSVEKITSLTFKGAWAYATCHYAGLNYSVSGDNSEPTYELSVGTAEQPIATHPDFITEIGGTPKAPKNGAIFESMDDTRRRWYQGAKGTPPTTNQGWKFVGFQIIVNDAGQVVNEFAGLTSYLDTQLTWRKQWTKRYSQTDVTGVGTIQTPQGGAPTLPAGYNWLYVGLDATRRGNAYSMTQQWRSSGRRGWNKKLYK